MKILKSRTVLGVICIVVSLLICFGVTPLFNKEVSKKVEIVRVVKDIKSGIKSLAIWSGLLRWEV